MSRSQKYSSPSKEAMTDALLAEIFRDVKKIDGPLKTPVKITEIAQKQIARNMSRGHAA